MKKKLLILALGASFAILSSSCTKQVDDTNEELKEIATAALRFQFVENDNFGSNFKTFKVQIVNAAIGAFNAKYPNGISGGNATDFAATALAIAMQETWNLTSNTGNAGSDTEYPWRDSKNPNAAVHKGPFKDGDASNFGHYKMNWFMIRQNAAFTSVAGSGRGVFEYGNYGDNNGWGERINDNMPWATRILLEYYARPGWGRPNGTRGNFWAGHRWGQTGWDGGGPLADIQGYYDAIQTVKNRIIRENIQSFKYNTKRYAHNIQNI